MPTYCQTCGGKLESMCFCGAKIAEAAAPPITLLCNDVTHTSKVAYEYARGSSGVVEWRATFGAYEVRHSQSVFLRGEGDCPYRAGQLYRLALTSE